MFKEDNYIYKVLVLSVVKHDYIPIAVAGHPRFKLVLVADDAENPNWVHERNQCFANKYNIEYIRNVKKAFNDYNIDVAVISSEIERHCDLAVRAAEAGINLIVDKPMSNKLSECDRLLKAIRRNNVKFLLWNRNFLPAIYSLKRELEKKIIGNIYAIHVDFYFSKDAGPSKRSIKKKGSPINWLERQLEAHEDGSDGGVGNEPLGELQIEGIYPLGYINYLTGAKIESVFASTATHFHQVNIDNKVEDLALVTLEMESEIIGTMCIGRIGASSHPDIGEIKLHILGDKGGIVWSESRPEISVYYKGQPKEEFKNIRIGNENNYFLMENYVKALDTGSDTILNEKESRDIAAVVQACLKSSKTGKKEYINENKGIKR